ncbi:ATP-grasp domain-containing protein [Neomoorella thermoacetica]|uniref:ATP-grasp domain-containing protein n=1 Tax=Neomoorella thermoacetica TaxID=1525 RepID=UPI0008FA2E69|nr:ATP-grasp domain-containing protein [Moorella thermoacetica]OIQ12666.1 D-alanine--D-alanine ligase [Moorella thermoacetica]
MWALKPDSTRYKGKTIMIIGAGRIQEPAIRIAKNLGLKVVAVDYDAGAPGLKWADYPLLISTTDVDACINAGRVYRIDGVITAGSDRSTRTVAAVAAALNLPGIPVEVAQNATNKLVIREALAACQVPSPRFVTCRSQAEAVKGLKTLGLPVVIKPPDNNSSFGVSVVRQESELEKALDWAAQFSNSPTLLMEEFIPGDEVGVQAFVLGGEVKIAAISSRQVTPPPFCSSIMTTVPALISSDTGELIHRVVTGAIQAMGINAGPVYVQLRLSPEGPRVLELSPRLGGGYTNSHLIPLALGINLIQAAIDFCLGYSPHINPQFRRGASRRYIILPPGTVQELPSLEQFNCPGLVEMGLFIKPGDIIPEFHSAAVASGYVITAGATPQTAARSASRLCREIESRIVVR